MPQPTDIRRIAGVACRPAVLAFLALLALASAAAAAVSAVHFYPDGLPASVGTHFQIDFNPSKSIQPETPSSMALFMPQGFVVDTTAVTKRCSPAQATAMTCPQASRIGFGHAVIHVSGYLLPGGGTDGIIYMTTFLAPPRQPGDPAGVVLYAQWLGVDQALKALNHYLPRPIPASTEVTGRIVRLGSGGGRYSLEVLFDGLPGGFRLPPPVTSAGIAAAVTTFKLDMGAIHRYKKPIVHVITAAGLNGPIVQRIKDHVLVAHHLFARPLHCPGSGMWPWQITVGFPDGNAVDSGQVRCHP
jgi:hypothetical protein